jgi:AcrR family transcriptional regulator
METTDAKRKPGRPREEGLATRRREEILDAATACFAQLGYRLTDIQLVANQLDVAKGTIYHYFPSKEQLFLAAVDRGVKLLSSAVDGSVREIVEPLERIRCAIREYLRFFSEHPQIVVLFIHERTEFRDRKRLTYFEHQDRRMGAWHQLLESLIADGRCRNVPVERVSNVVNDILYGTIFTNYFSGRKTSFERQAEDVLDIVFHGILSDQERAQRSDPTAA